MSLIRLRDSIERKDAKLAVIGLGYVGLPVACQFAKAGFNVIGVEIQPDRVEQINHGISPIEGNEPGLAGLLIDVTSSGHLHATSDYRKLSDREVILIDVETPVDEQNFPRYEALRAVIHQLGKVIKPGSLIIVESTIAPGTMDNLVLPLLSEISGLSLNQGFYLGHCPERVMPGKLLTNLKNVSRVVGGMTPETADTMLVLYQHIVHADLDLTDCITAELVKTTENAYRDVQIAFANEIALICEAVGGDVWKVRDLVNKSPFRNMHLPGAGVGGHCITKDPWLLAYATEGKNVPLRLIPAARAVNDSMPLHMVDLLRSALRSQGIEITGAKILVMGYAYLEDSDDTRNSPSKILVNRLLEMGAEVVIHDSYIGGYNGDVYELGRGCDAAVLMVRHQTYIGLDLAHLRDILSTPVLVDGRGMYRLGAAQAAKLMLWGIGQANPHF